MSSRGARRRPLDAASLAAASMVLVAAAFFLPWVEWLPAKRVRIEQGARGDRKELSRGVKSVELTVRRSGHLSGYQIPRAANSEAAKAAVQVAGLLQRAASSKTEDLRTAGAKSYAVYLLPGLHLLLGALLLRFGRRRLVAAPIAVIALAVPPVGWWQVTAALAQSGGAAAARYGLWLSLLAYWGLAAAALRLLSPLKPS